MQSKLFATVLAICRFIPIPVVQLVVHIVDAVRAAYMVYQGIKHKSLSAVLGGVAGLISGAGNVAGAFGASAATVNTISSVAKAASNLSMAYSAVANKDMSAAMGLLGSFGGQGSTLSTATNFAQQGLGIRDAVRNRDALGAFGGTLGLAAGATSDSATRDDLSQAQQVVTGLRAAREIGRGNLDAAQSLAMNMDGAQQARREANAISAQQRADEAAANNRSLLNANAGDAALRAGPATADDQRDGSDVDADNTAARNAGVRPSSTPPSLTVGKGQTLEGIARAHYGENWRAGLAQMAIDNGLKLNQWGSPMLRQGQDLVLSDISGTPEHELDRLARTGGRIIANNDRGLQVKADLEERARDAVDMKTQERTARSPVVDDMSPTIANAKARGLYLDVGATSSAAEGLHSLYSDWSNSTSLVGNLAGTADNVVLGMAKSQGIEVLQRAGSLHLQKIGSISASAGLSSALSVSSDAARSTQAMAQFAPAARTLGFASPVLDVAEIGLDVMAAPEGQGFATGVGSTTNAALKNAGFALTMKLVTPVCGPALGAGFWPGAACYGFAAGGYLFSYEALASPVVKSVVTEQAQRLVESGAERSGAGNVSDIVAP